jgi:hypothetical protein
VALPIKTYYIMQRITKKVLIAQVENLNRITLINPDSAYLHSLKSVNSNPGAYDIDYAYGGVQLIQYNNSNGGCRNVFSVGFASKRKLSELISAYIKGIQDSPKQ